MTNCKLDYIEKLNLEKTEEGSELKDRLYAIVKDIAPKLRKFDLFHYSPERKLRIYINEQDVSSKKHTDAQIFIDEINEFHKGEFVTLVPDPENPKFLAVKLDPITPLRTQIEPYANTVDDAEFDNFDEKDFLTFEGIMFGRTDLAQKDTNLTEALSNKMTVVEDKMQTIIDKLVEDMKGVVPRIGRDSTFTHFGSSELIHTLYNLQSNRELSVKITRYIGEALARSGSLHKLITKEDQGVQEAFSLMNSIDIHDPDLSDVEKKQYENSSYFIAKTLFDAESYLHYFKPLGELKNAMNEAGVRTEPLSKYNGINLEEQIITFLSKQFTELESYEILEESLEEGITEESFILKIENEILKRGKKESYDEGAIETTLFSIFEDTIKKDKKGNPYTLGIVEFLTQEIGKHEETIGKVTELSLDFASKRLYDEIREGNPSITLKETKRLILVQDKKDSLFNEWLGSPEQQRDMIVQSFAKIIDNRRLAANAKKLDIQASVDKLESLAGDRENEISNTITEDRLYLTPGETVEYMSENDNSENFKIVKIAGKEFKVKLKKNKFIVGKKDYISANIETAVFKNEKERLGKDYLELFKDIDINDFEEIENNPGEYYLEKSVRNSIVKGMQDKFKFTSSFISKKVVKALREVIKNPSSGNKLVLDSALQGNLYSLFAKDTWEEKDFKSKKEILTKKNIERIEDKFISSETDVKVLEDLERKHFVTHEVGKNLNQTLEKLQWYSGMDLDHGTAGFLYVLTEEGELTKLYYNGSKGDRDFRTEMLTSGISKVYTLSYLFNNPTGKYNNPKYEEIQNKIKKGDSVLENSYNELLSFYSNAQQDTNYSLQFGMVPQVLKSEIETTLIDKLKNPKKTFSKEKENILKAFSLKGQRLEDVTMLLKAHRDYTYIVQELDSSGTLVDKEVQVQKGDLIDGNKQLILDENDEKETDEKKGARRLVHGVGVYNEEIKEVKKRYTAILPVETIEDNVFENIKKFSMYAAENREMNIAAVEGGVMLSALANRKTKNTRVDHAGDRKELISRFEKEFTKKSIMSVKIMSDFYDLNVYGIAFNQSTTKFGGREYDTFKLTNKIKAIVGWQALAFNVVAPIGNLSIGTVNNMLMAIQGKVLDTKTYLRANKVFWQQMGRKGAIMDIFTTKMNDKSMMAQLFNKFQAIQGIEYSIDEQVEMNGFGIREFAYLSSSLPEYKLQGTLSLGIMMKTMHKGESVFNQLEKLWEESQNSHVSYSQLITNHFSEKFIVGLTQKIQAANTKAHGNYLKANKSQLQRFAMVELALIFKRWIWSSIMNRFREKRYSVYDKSFETGYQRVFMENLYSGLLENFNNPDKTRWKKIVDGGKIIAKGQGKTLLHVANALSFGKLSTFGALQQMLYTEDTSLDDQKEMFRAASELSLFVALTLITTFTYGLGKGEDEEEDNHFLLTMSYYLTRLQNDLGVFLPHAFYPGIPGGLGVLNSWDNAYRIIQDPFTIERTLETNMGLIGQLITFYQNEEGDWESSIFEKYKTSGYSYKKGDLKVWRKVKKSLIPLVYQVERLINIEDQIRYLDMMRATSR